MSKQTLNRRKFLALSATASAGAMAACAAPAASPAAAPAAEVSAGVIKKLHLTQQDFV